MAIVSISTASDADFYKGFVYQTVDGDPISLAGCTMHMGIRRKAEDIAEVLLLTTENGGLIITDAANGKFTVWITQAQLEHLAPDDYVHSLIRTVATTDTTLNLEMWSGTLTHAAGPSR